MSERFPARKGISASLRQRLGDFGNKATTHEQSRDNFQAKVRDTRKETSKKQDSLSKGYNSGDSLEMDEGDDLRGELDGHHAANMVIQVCIKVPESAQNLGDYFHLKNYKYCMLCYCNFDLGYSIA